MKNKSFIIPEKSADRVAKFYKLYTDDWKAQYNMLLDDGVTCGQCVHANRCRTIFGGNDSNTSCQFYPNKFYPKL